MRSFDVLGVRVDDLLPDELRARLLAYFAADAPNLIVTPNAEMILAARGDAAFCAVLNTSTIALPDGVALRFAVAALHGEHNLHRHPGVDALVTIGTLCRSQGISLVLLGATDLILAQAKMRFATLAQGVSIITVNPGFIDAERPQLNEDILRQLQSIGICVVAVALGQGKGKTQGKQERIAVQIVSRVPNARIVIGVGGALDMLSGSVQRAPNAFQRYGMEWLWRLGVEPWRFLRIFRAVIVFPVVVFWSTIQQKRWRIALVNVSATLRLHFFSRA